MDFGRLWETIPLNSSAVLTSVGITMGRGHLPRPGSSWKAHEVLPSFHNHRHTCGLNLGLFQDTSPKSQS